VERNPVRAGLVETAEEYRWSSARAHLGYSDDFLDLGEWLVGSGAAEWREVLRGGIEDESFEQRLRDASKRGRALGSDAFIEQLAGVYS
jgi:putative transposase